MVDLGALTDTAGAALLQARGVVGEPEELAQASRDFAGHALALYLLGGLLARYCDGDVRRRDVVGPLAGARERGEHARGVMAVYECWLPTETMAVWSLLGLFDRPAAPSLIAALRAPPIPGLTEGLAGLSERGWRDAVEDLKGLKLLSQGQDGSLDAHPLVREHLGAALQARDPAAWQAGHLRLYETLCAGAEDQPSTLATLEPLLQGFAHGCQGGRHQEPLDEVYWRRVRRGNDAYIVHHLGAFASDLAALAWFFAEPWTRPEPSLTKRDQALVLGWAGFALRALGRLGEARGPMEAGLEARVSQADGENAAIAAGNLSELHATLGDLAAAEARAREAVAHADRKGDGFQRMSKRTTLADALHQRGRRAEARELFGEAEGMQAEMQPARPMLHSLWGCRYCDLLLGTGEANEALQRTETALRWAEERAASLVDIALDHLLLGRAVQALGDCATARTHRP